MGKGSYRLKLRRLLSMLLTLVLVLALVPPVEVSAVDYDTVVFDYQCDELKEDEQTVTDGYAKKPESDPVRAGYIFGGWYTSKDYNWEYDFNKKILENGMTENSSRTYRIYAKWIQEIDTSGFTKLTDGYSEELTLAPAGVKEKWYSFIPTKADEYNLTIVKNSGINNSNFNIYYGTTPYEMTKAGISPQTFSLTAETTYYFQIIVNATTKATGTIEFKSKSGSSGTEDKKQIGECESSIEKLNWTYTGSAITPTVTVKDGSTQLTEGVDYTVSYANNINAGPATITITGIGKYTSYTTIGFNIISTGTDKKDISSCTIEDIPNQTYTGSAITPTVTVRDGSTLLTKGTDYTVSYANNINAGTATITITGMGTKYTGQTTKTFTIITGTKEISKCTIDNIPDQPYTGSAITPTVTVRDGSTQLTAGVDYTVSYANNIDAGTATITIAGTGIKYTGQTTKTFTIIIVTKEISQCTIDNISDQTYIGSAITPTVTVRDGQYTLIKDVDYTVSYANNINAGTAAITITGTGTKYTGQTTKEFTILKATNPPNLPAANREVAGNVTKVRDVSLTGNWQWQAADRDKLLNPETPVVATAEYIGEDKANYTNVTAEVSITRNRLDVTAFELNQASVVLKGKDSSCQLNITNIKPVNPDAYTVVWTSENEKVARVEGNGDFCTVTAGQSGETKVTAEINGIRKSCTVTVTNPITGFKLNSDAEEIVVGNSTILSIAETTPEEPDAYTVTWESSDEDVVTVKQAENKNSGKVTAVGEGCADITAKIECDEEIYTQTCQVTVKVAQAQLTGISISPTEMSLERGVGENIDVKPVPGLAALGTITFVSDRPDVATVDEDGRVVAGESGIAVITVTAGDFSETCTVTVSNVLTSFELDKTASAMKAGEKMELSVISLKPESPDLYEVEWSADSDAVSVDDMGNVGNVTAVKTGTATVTASINGITRSCRITVTTPATGFSLDTESVNLTEGNSQGLTYRTVPENADNTYTMSWSSSDESVATVAAGLITAQTEGEADITARMTVGGQLYEKTCHVTVKAAIKDIAITPNELSLKAGERSWINVSPVPESAVIGQVTYESGNENIVQVDAKGQVTAVGSGQTTITVTAGEFTKTCSVTVEKNDPSLCTVVYVDDKGVEITRTDIATDDKVVLPEIDKRTGCILKWKDSESGTLYDPQTEITVKKDMTFVIDVRKILVNSLALNVSEKTIKVGEGFTISVASVQPEDAFDKGVTWSSSNTAIATVDASGKVTGVAAGQAEIKAIAKDGSGKTAACKVTVTAAQTGDKGTEEVSVGSIKITGPTKKVAPGKGITLVAEVYPENAADKQVTWSVDNSKYASVNGSGVVTTKKAGKGKSVVVTASSKDGTVKATYKISIMKNAVKKIKLTGKKSLKIGKSTKLKVKITPNKNVSKEIAWNSSKPEVATVSSKGKVVAKKKGKTKITAKAKDGSGKKATITITVK